MVKFESRATVGLVAPVSRPAIPGPVEGTGVHYNGRALGLLSLPSHEQCRGVWRFIQRFHMGNNHPNPYADGRHWHDIAYSFGVCPHEVVMAGRGHGVRTAANGTKEGNDGWYGGMLLIGGTEAPTDGMLLAFAEAARGFGAPFLRPHSWFKSTACPGDPTRDRIVNGSFDIEEDVMSYLEEHLSQADKEWLVEMVKESRRRKVDTNSLAHIVERWRRLRKVWCD